MGAATDQQRLAQALCNPGRFVLGPTQTTGSFPYGGVSLGFHRDGEALWHAEYIQVRDPASGRVSEVGRNGAEYPEIYALIEGTAWDEDLLLATFSRATRPSSLAVTTPPEARIEGTSIPPAVVQAWPPVLFAADDPTHKSIYFRRPVPTLSLKQAVAIAKAKKAGLPVRFIPTPDAAWATTPDYQIARLENITL